MLNNISNWEGRSCKNHPLYVLPKYAHTHTSDTKKFPGVYLNLILKLLIVTLSSVSFPLSRDKSVMLLPYIQRG